ncbi:hypothetical protein C8J57DRAFT_1524831 [Mycena rebaudengoi]|nr:hypothetical protein C8J57DRAFT_1524831 [Mycena rebaudengoi]
MAGGGSIPHRTLFCGWDCYFPLLAAAQPSWRTRQARTPIADVIFTCGSRHLPPSMVSGVYTHVIVLIRLAWCRLCVQCQIYTAQVSSAELLCPFLGGSGSLDCRSRCGGRLILDSARPSLFASLDSRHGPMPLHRHRQRSASAATSPGMSMASPRGLAGRAAHAVPPARARGDHGHQCVMYRQAKRAAMDAPQFQHAPGPRPMYLVRMRRRC